MLGLIEDVKRRGVNIVLSSHLLPDVERVCESVIMLNQGALIHTGKVADLKEDGDTVIEIQTKDDETFLKILQDADFKAVRDGLKLKVTVGSIEDGNSIFQLAVANDVQVRHFMPTELTLETAFLGMLENA